MSSASPTEKLAGDPRADAPPTSPPPPTSPLLSASPPTGPAPAVADLLAVRAGGAAAHRPLFTALGPSGEPVARFTPAELDVRARAVADALLTTGRPGDRVLLPPLPVADFPTAFFGCLYAGMVAVPVAEPAGPSTAAVARHHRATAMLVPDRAAPPPPAGVTRVELGAAVRAGAGRHGPAARPEPLAPALLAGTGGTAGAVGHGELVAGQAAVRDRCDVDADTTVVSWLPLSHGTGLATALVLPLVSGAASVVLEPAAFLRDPGLWLRAVEAEEDVVAAAPAGAYELCARRAPADGRMRVDLSTWRVAAVGGDGGRPVRPGTLRRFADAFRPGFFREEVFVPGYGPGRGLPAATLGRPLHPAATGHYDRAALARGAAVPVPPTHPGAVALVGRGTPLPGTGVRVADPVSGRTLPERAVGEIRVDAPAGPAGGPRDRGFLDGGELFVTGRAPAASG
ncbi:AMP-binding protein [Streptomyces sp. NPDC015131]|uniref:AMP-binding protein n=1 Tax=Streptomyces sp. NPDC015131 TaxID=3364941 RepID=UPI0036FD2624